jgi:RimJ/RimL family protein N-acetyltransferase
MIYDKPINGLLCSLHFVKEEDAEFIISLRSDPDLIKFLHPIETDIEKQKDWIRQQQQKEGDYYFIVKDLNNEKVGTNALYDVNFEKSQAQGGRTICKNNPLIALESAILICDFGFYILNLDRLYVRVNVDNIKTANLHKRFGTKPFVCEFTDPLTNIKYHEYQTLKSEWPVFRKKFIDNLNKIS